MSKLSDMVATVAGAVKSVLNPDEDARALSNLERRAQRIADALGNAEAELADEAIGAAALDGQDERRAARKDLGSKHETVNRWRAERDANDLATARLRDRIETREREARELEEAKAEAVRKAQLALAANGFLVTVRRLDVVAKDLASAQIAAEDGLAALYEVLTPADLSGQERNDLTGSVNGHDLRSVAIARARRLERELRGMVDETNPAPSAEQILLRNPGFAAILEAGR